MSKAFSAVAIGAALVAAGCGGGGGSNLDSAPVVNPLVGYYGGKGTETGTQAYQFARMGVSSDGILCGTIYDKDTKTHATLGAAVSATGQVTQGSVAYTDSKGDPIDSGSLSGQIIGLKGTTGSGGVSASLVATVGSSAVTYTFPTLSAPVRLASRRRKAAASQTQEPGG